MSHTPGPWIAHDDLIYTSEQDLPTVTYVAKAFTPANARLIAAAPELLSAAFQALACLETLGRAADVRAILAKAIAQAEGKPYP